MQYRYPKPDNVLDLLEVVDNNLQGWKIKKMCSFGFWKSLHPLTTDAPKIERYARNFIHGGHQPYLICYLEDYDAIEAFHLIEIAIRKMAQPIREELTYVNRRKSLAISLGGIDVRKIANPENRCEICPRAGRILTTAAYEKIMGVDPLAFHRTLGYDISPNFSVP